MYGNCCQTKFRSRQLQPILQKAQNLLLRSTFQYSCTKKKFYTLLTLPYYFVLIVHIIVGKTVGKADFDNFLSNFILMFRNIFRINRQGVKNGFFTVRLRARGEGGSAPTALTISKCEIFDPLFHWNLNPWYSKHISSHVEGSQKCVFHAFFTYTNYR